MIYQTKRTTAADVIKEARKEKGVTQGQLAEEAGVSKSSVANIETGRTPTASTAGKQIVKVLGLDPFFLALMETLEVHGMGCTPVALRSFMEVCKPHEEADDA